VKSKIIKAGYLTIVATIMIAFTRAFITDSCPSVETGHFNVGSNSQNLEYTLWDTRTRRVVIDVSPATARINVYLLDEEGINLLYDEGRLQPVFSLEDVDGCDFTYQPQYRGAYLFIIQNISNRTASISRRVISQGLEWDILQFSAVLGIAGVTMFLLPCLLRREKR